MSKRQLHNEYEQQQKSKKQFCDSTPPTAFATRVANAAALTDEACFKRRQAVTCIKLACLVNSENNINAPENRVLDVLQLLKEDSERPQPLLDLSHELAVRTKQSGGELLLTDFIQFLCRSVANTTTLAFTTIQYKDIFQQLQAHIGIIRKLLSRAPAKSKLNHSEERNALVLLASFAVPNTDTGNFLVEVGCALVLRGADVHARGSDGFTPMQYWCRNKDATYAKGIHCLLHAGADLDATNKTGWVVLYALCNHASSNILGDLIEAGWLDTANIDIRGVGEATPTQLLQSKLQRTPRNAEVREKLQLLSAVSQNWLSYIRPAMFAELDTHKQLVPDIAAIIVSFIDGKIPIAPPETTLFHSPRPAVGGTDVANK